MATGDKAPGAFLTISELSDQLGVAQHILRYWETKFPQLRPLQRAGNRRYYRPADVELARRIHRLLHEEGYTVKGVQKLLRQRGPSDPALPAADPAPAADAAPATAGLPAPTAAVAPAAPATSKPPLPLDRLIDLRDRLVRALD